ncbi:MAG: HD-GYP domain-containing protein [Clostridiales bacterium]|nr:HD-GYP domain-containing protein [Clostridiales bacterium]
MIFIPTSSLKPGMVVAKTIVSSYDNSPLPLVTKGSVLTNCIIRRLEERSLSGCYIDTEFTKDIEPGEIIGQMLKKKALNGIKKVFDEVSVTRKISMDNLSLVTEIAKELVLQILESDEILIDFLDLQNYDDYTYRHSLSVAIFSVAIGHKLGYSTSLLMDLATGALLHDIGKTEISIDLINKPGRLTDEEYATIRLHPEMAVERLKSGHSISSFVLNGILSHHERFNGTGYPRGLSGTDIPVYGRILAVADVYDALTSVRPYRKAWFPDEAIEYLVKYRGIHFDPEIIDAFLKIVVPYPVGTMVELSNGCPAIVIRNNENKMRPVVRMFNVEDDIPFREVDLMNDKGYEDIYITNLGYNSRLIDYNAFVARENIMPEDISDGYLGKDGG